MDVKHHDYLLIYSNPHGERGERERDRERDRQTDRQTEIEGGGSMQTTNKKLIIKDFHY